MNPKQLIYIVAPAYNEEEGISFFLEELKIELEKIERYEFKVLIVDDGSTDETLLKIRELRKRESLLSFISLSKNRGKEIALIAGLDHVPKLANAAVIMDTDLQHPPNIIPRLIEKWEGGAKDVYAKRANRDYESLVKRLLSWLYYKIVTLLLQQKLDSGAGDFRLLDRKALDAMTSLRESQRYTKGLYDLIGFKKSYVEFTVPERKYGKTSWNAGGLFRLAIDGITSYSTLPLRMATFLGITVSILSFIYMSYIITKTILYGDPVAGYPSMISILLFLGGAQLLSIGILGEYIGKIFHESKKRPLYFIEEHEE